MLNKEKKIAVIGLGYVGLPLAIELAKKKYEIILSSRSEGRLQETAKEIDRLKNRAEARGRRDEYRYDSLRSNVS